MSVSYNGKKIIPGPFASISKNYVTTDDGRKISSGFQITLEGTLVAYKGSPTTSGTFWELSGYPPDEVIGQDSYLTAILRKQEALRELFADEGKSFEIQGYDGAAPLKANPRLAGPIDFRRGSPISWVHKCEFTVTLLADVIYINGTSIGEDDDELTQYHIDKFTENWNIESADENSRTFRLTHQLSAKGKRFYDEAGTLTQEAWENARDYVLVRTGLGIDATQMIASGVLDLNTYTAYNYLRNQSVNEAGGEFSVAETWLCFNNSGGYHAIEEFSVNTRIGEDNKVSVGVEGNIKGLELRDNTTRALVSTRWENASGKWDEVSGLLSDRASNLSGYSLHPTPMNRTIGRNEINGVVNYSYEYNNRPTAFINGAVSEVINISYDNPCDIFAEIPIVGRAAGPLLQDMETKTSRKRNLSIEYVMASSGQSLLVEGDTDALVALYTPSAYQVFKSKDTPTFSPTTGRGSRNVSWTIEV